MVVLVALQYAPGPPAVDYDPLKTVEWALGSVQHSSVTHQPYPWEPKVSTDAAEPLPAFGVKQAVNSPLDFGPYASEAVTLSTKSWPGQRPAPAPNQEITLLVNDMNGAKIPVRCRLSDPVESLRKQIFQKMHGQMKLQELDDDADTRLVNALANPANPDTRIKTVVDVANSTTLPGNVHYRRSTHVEPSALATDRQLRKPAPIPGKYKPPKRCPQTAAELELYVGALKMDDGQLQFSRSINTGEKPQYKVLHLHDYMITDGTVVRAEYVASTAEYKMRDPDRDMEALGTLPDADTACQRVRDTILDPDFYVGTAEQMPRMLMEFLIPPGGDEDGPFVGRLEPVVSAQSGSSRGPAQVPFRTQYVPQYAPPRAPQYPPVSMPPSPPAASARGPPGFTAAPQQRGLQMALAQQWGAAPGAFLTHAGRVEVTPGVGVLAPMIPPPSNTYQPSTGSPALSGGLSSGAVESRFV